MAPPPKCRTTLPGAALALAFTCPIADFESVTAEGPVDCKIVAANIALAREFSVPWFIKEVEWDSLKYVPLKIKRTAEWRDPAFVEYRTVFGSYSRAEGIAVGRTMQALLHEILHHLEWLRGTWPRTRETQHGHRWLMLAWHEADAYFASQCRNPSQ